MNRVDVPTLYILGRVERKQVMPYFVGGGSNLVLPLAWSVGYLKAQLWHATDYFWKYFRSISSILSARHHVRSSRASLDRLQLLVSSKECSAVDHGDVNSIMITVVARSS